MKNRLNRADILNAIILFILVAAVFVLPYCLTKLCLFGRGYLTPRIFIDDYIPLWTPSVVVYVLAYVQWVVCLFGVLFQDTERKYRSVAAIIYAMLITTLIYIAVPTNTVRPEITCSTVFDGMLRFIYSTDTPVNVLPSCHCLASWLLSRCLASDKRTPLWAVIINFVFTVLVFASVLLTKQHLFLDIPAAILVAEIALALSKRFVPVRFFDKLQYTKDSNSHSDRKDNLI